MPAQQSLGGYPGLRRTPTVKGSSVPDLRGSRPLKFPANDPIYRNSKPASETFLRDQTRKVFGTKVATGTGQAVARHILARGLPRLIPYIGWGLTAYEAYEFLKPGQAGGNLPRDDNVPADVAISFPSNWTFTNRTPWPSESAPAYEAATEEHRALNYGPRVRWYKETGTASPIYCEQDGYLHADEYIAANFPTRPTTHQQITSTKWNTNRYLIRYSHFDAQPHHPDRVYIPKSHGMRQDFYWQKTTIGANPTYTNAPRQAPATAPQLVRIDAPIPTPYRAIPHRRPNEWLSPREQTERGPAPEPASPTNPRPVVRGAPGRSWVPAPIVFGKPYQAIASPPVPRGPSPPREKEKKVRIRKGGVVQFISRAIGQVTEGFDAMNAAYFAIPEQFRPGYYALHRKDGSVYYKKRWNASAAQRGVAVYQQFDKIEFGQFLENVVKNEIQDRAIGKASQAHQNSAGVKRFGHGRSFQFGPWDKGFGSPP